MGNYSDTFSSVAAGRAANAASAANSNLNASIALLQMVNNMDKAIHEMRDWQTGRFNEIIVAMRNMKEQINDLQGQVAGLQRKLYEEEQKNKGIAR